MLDQFKVVRGLTTRVGEGVGVVPLDPYLSSLPWALRRSTDYRPAGLEQTMTPDHQVADTQLSHKPLVGNLRSLDLRSSFNGPDAL